MSIRDQIPVSEPRWYAVLCKYRCEKNLCTEFLERGIEAYVPIQKKIRQYASRKKSSEVALIPSHVFVHIDRSRYLEILQHTHVFKFLNISGIISAIPQSEMDMMKRVVGQYEEVILDHSNYTIGDEVQIVSGDLTGLKGILIAENNHNFKIALASLGLGLLIQVDPKNLIKTGSAKQVA